MGGIAPPTLVVTMRGRRRSHEEESSRRSFVIGMGKLRTPPSAVLVDVQCSLRQCPRLCRVFPHHRTVNVILREDLEGRGYKGEEITVKGGYMRNFLFPAQKAVYATEENRAVYQSVQKVQLVRAPACCHHVVK